MRPRTPLGVLLLLTLAACSDSGTGNSEPYGPWSTSWAGYFEHMRSSCVRASACYRYSVTECLYGYANDDYLSFPAMCTDAFGCRANWVREVACEGTATTCAEYWACRRPPGTEDCDTYEFREHCDGDTIVTCNAISPEDHRPGWIARTDCSQASGGGTCGEHDGTLGCQFDLCLPEPGTGSCDGSVWRFCEEHEYEPLFWVLDCAELGLACHPEASCVDRSGETCTLSPEGWYEASCDGAHIEACSRGHVTHWDCGLIDPDFVCFDDEGQKRCAMPEGLWECPANDSGWCVGTVAHSCIFGREVTVDCADLPGAICVERYGEARCELPEE